MGIEVRVGRLRRERHVRLGIGGARGAQYPPYPHEAWTRAPLVSVTQLPVAVARWHAHLTRVPGGPGTPLSCSPAVLLVAAALGCGRRV